MRNIVVLREALSCIEDALPEGMTPEAVAACCYCSLSSLQKLFRYALGMGICDYTNRRRLTLASRALLETDETVTGVALRFGYQSPEVFTRAFRRLWGTAPSVFRQRWRFSTLFPRIESILEEENGNMRRQMDMTELYDTLKDREDAYVLCFDIVGLMPINEIAMAAGDLAIVESLRRIDGAATEDKLLFRIGGDEFALVTPLKDRDAVRRCAEKVLVHNGEPIVYEGRSIPLFLRAGALRLGKGNLRYAELFDALERSVDKSSDLGAVHFAGEA